MKVQEKKYYGLHACLALWKRRASDLIRVYLHESNVKALAPLLKWCAAQKKAYHIVSAQELVKITDSVHHEGICVLAKEPPAAVFSDLLTKREPACLLYLDGVQNPHNIGSIMRTCAHFGVSYILGEQLPALSASACRIAKGGAEFVRLVSLSKPADALEKLKREDYALIATSSHRGTPLYQYRFPAKAILVFGSESSGVSKGMSKLAMQTIQIPGTGMVESLNVSVAASLCLGEFARQNLRFA